MAKVYTVTKAFQSTDKDTKEPQVINTKGGEMHKFMVQVADQPVAGWLSILKKPGNVVNEGDELYGFIDENQWGKPNFTAAQRPEGMQLKTSNSKPSSTPAPSGISTDLIHDKLDEILRLLRGVDEPVIVPNTESEPVDLEKLGY